MELTVGEVYEGKVTKIAKFGAFVGFEGGRSGLVHISEIANSFVSDIQDYVREGQSVRVKVLSIGNDGKINLSIKQTGENAPQPSRAKPQNTAASQTAMPARIPVQEKTADSGNSDFESRLKKFMQESDSRIADNRMYSDRKQRSRRR